MQKTWGGREYESTGEFREPIIDEFYLTPDNQVKQRTAFDSLYDNPHPWVGERVIMTQVAIINESTHVTIEVTLEELARLENHHLTCGFRDDILSRAQPCS